MDKLYSLFQIIQVTNWIQRVMSVKKIFFCVVTAVFLLSSCGYSQKELDEAIAYAYEDGESSGYDDGYDDGHFDGKSDGYTEGWNDGYIDGYEDGCFDATYGERKGDDSTDGSNTGKLIKISRTVYITKTGNKYHKFGCQYLDESMYETTLSDAKEKGYTACSRCWQ